MVNPEIAMNEHPDDWTKVQAALDNPAWDFRTVDGIARETSLPREAVLQVLREHGAVVRQTVSRDKRSRGWRIVFTLKSRPRKFREFFADFLTFASQ